MTPFEHLGIVAGISATLLGFIAVFIALSNDEGRFTESDRHFIQALVLTSATAIIYSLTPGVLNLYFVEQTAWDISIVLAMLLGIVVSLVMVWEQWHMSTKESKKVNWKWHVPAWGFSTSAYVLVVLAFFSESNATAFYVGGISLMIPISLWCFIAVVFRKYF